MLEKKQVEAILKKGKSATLETFRDMGVNPLEASELASEVTRLNRNI